jgi:hypothetical protein
MLDGARECLCKVEAHVGQVLGFGNGLVDFRCVVLVCFETAVGHDGRVCEVVWVGRR